MKVNDTIEAKIGCITSSKISEMCLHPKNKLLVSAVDYLSIFFFHCFLTLRIRNVCPFILGTKQTATEREVHYLFYGDRAW